jgi:hypothetical protein
MRAWWGLLLAAACAGEPAVLQLGVSSIPAADHAVQVPLSLFSVPADLSRISDRLLERCASGARVSIPLEFAVVEVRQDAVSVSGQTVVPVLEGGIPESQKRGQLISPLYERLLGLAERSKAFGERMGHRPVPCAAWSADGDSGFAGRVLLVVDARVPFSTVREVLFTAGQAQFGSFYLMVDAHAEPHARHGAVGDDRPMRLSVRVDGAAITVQGDDPALSGAGAQLRCPAGDCAAFGYDWDGMSALLTDLVSRRGGRGGAILVPAPTVPASVVLRAMELLTADPATGEARFDGVVVAGGLSGDGGQAFSGPVAPVASRFLGLHDPVWALRSTLPAIGAPATSDVSISGGIGGLLGALGTRAGERGELSGVSIDLLLLDPALAGQPPGGAPSEAANAVRSWFPDSLLFAPSVITDEAGLAQVDVLVPDQLTGWRLVALAHDRAGRQAGAEARIQSTLPAYVEVRAPLRVRLGDRISVPIQAVNRTDAPITTTLVARAEGGLRGELERALVVPPLSTRVVSLAVLAHAAEPGTLVAQLGETDAVRRGVEVVPMGRRVEQRVGGTLGAQVRLTLAPPPGASHGLLEVAVLQGGRGVLASEMAAQPATPFNLAEAAYRVALVGAAQHPSVAGDAPPDAALRALRIRAWQGLLSQLPPSPGVQDAVVALEAVGGVADRNHQALARQLAELVRRAQSPDGSFLAASEGKPLEAGLVFAAEASRATAELSPEVGQRAAAWVGRHARRVVDPHTAAALLAADLVPEPEVARLVGVVVGAAEPLPTGGSVVVPGRLSRTSDGVRPGSVATTSLALLALHPMPEHADLVADLGTALLSKHRPGRGFGDPGTNLLALDAMRRLLDEEPPPQIGLRMEGPLGQLATGTLEGAGPVSLSLRHPPERIRLRAEPASPGLVYGAVRSDWVALEPHDGVGLGVVAVPPTRARAGQLASVQLTAQVPRNLSVELRLGLPVGVYCDPDQALEGVERLKLVGDELRLTLAPTLDGLFLGAIAVVPTMAGEASWGAAALVTPEGASHHAVGRWTVE